MSNPYFRNLSEFDYVNRTEGGKNSGDYTRVKNLFKKGKYYCLRGKIYSYVANASL